MRVELVRQALARMLIGAVAISAPIAANAEERAPAPAAAETSDRVLLLNEQGAELFAARDYRGALEHFEEAYRLEQDPNLLYNIASCQRALGAAEVAIEKYRAFLAAAGPRAPGRDQARAAVRELEQAQAPAPVPVRPSAPSAPVTRPAERSWLDHPVVPWVALGGGALSVLAGGTLYALGVRDHDRLENTPGFGNAATVTSRTRADSQALVDSGSNKKWLGGATLVVGAALLSGYAAVWYLREPPHDSGVSRQVGLDIRRDGGSVSLQGSF